MGVSGEGATARLAGVFPIVATPFRADGSPDRGDLARIVDFLVQARVDGIVFPGVASEFDTLTPRERTELVGVVAEANAGRVPLVIGVSASDAETAAGFASQARELRAAAVMAMAPSPMRDSSDAIAAYYARIGDEGVPIILQNAPPPAGCGLAPERVLEVAAGNAAIRYVKEETLPCGQRITKLLAGAPPTLEGVFGGAGGRYITDELARGACGTMPACELADVHVAQFGCHRAGDAAGVRRWFNRMLPLLNFQAVFRMAMTKEVLRRRGIIAATHVRAAGPVPDAGDLAELSAMLAQIAGEFRMFPLDARA